MTLREAFKKHLPRLEAPAFLRYIGPGLLVTVGFIDPGNWASNIAAGAGHGYALLWMVTLATFMLDVLQHNVAHLGIATGLCLRYTGSLPMIMSGIRSAFIRFCPRQCEILY